MIVLDAEQPSKNGKSRNGDDSGADAAEQAVLATVLRYGQMVPAASALTPQDFRVFHHRTIWEAIMHLSGDGKPCNDINVAHFLKTKDQIGRFNRDVTYDDLNELREFAFEQGLVPEGLFEYVAIVRDNSDRRRLLLVAREIQAIARWRGPVNESVEAIKQELSQFEQSPAALVLSGLDEVEASELASSAKTYHLDYLPLLGQDGYLVKGWSHLLAGYPRSGKSELLAACCRDWLRMGESVLYFTEEPESIWQLRVAKHPDAWAGMRLVFALGADPLVMKTRMLTGQETITVIDSIRNLGLVGHDETDNTAMAAAITPWVFAARQKKKTLVLSHHARKGGGQHGEGIAGAHALLGTVDIALELGFDNCSNRRLVKAHARIIQPAELMYERREDGTMHALGSPDSVSLVEVRRRVIDALEGEWLKTAEVRDRLEDPKPSQNAVRQALLAEAEAGTIERDPPLVEGKAERKTHRWRRAGGGDAESNLFCAP